MLKIGTYFAIAVAMAFGMNAQAGEEVSINDCGASLAQVKQIIQSRFSSLDPDVVKGFIGRWIYPGKEPISITLNSPIDIMGYHILACPQANGNFTVLWKNDKSKAGVLTKNGPNRIVISTLGYGKIKLDREGSRTAASE
jgi:hypothetical protein